jgi:hypothetical protein
MTQQDRPALRALMRRSLKAQVRIMDAPKPTTSLRGAKRRSNPFFPCREMDCFAEPVIGRAFARPGGSQ